MKLKIPKAWAKYLQSEIKKEYMLHLQNFLESELSSGKTIYPPSKDIFSAFKTTSLEQIKVVIIGQDPYHGEGQAHGLSFSVKNKIKIPPSLANIFKELKSDLGIETPKSGCLQSWAEQGVFLLNTVLTVEAHQANSHRKKGWEIFTDEVIELINEKCNNVVFLLWGAPAQKKAQILDHDKHLVLIAPHPSPLSSYRGFFGCKHFSKVNKYLKRKNRDQINWNLSDTRMSKK